MLTIKTNIDYKCLTPMCKTKDPLSEKILGDYDLIKADFIPEELLHLMTETPDIYFQEGQISNILNDNRVVTNQNIKVDVLNNMLNRLMMTAVDKSSYRDTVYIENVLRKLGITDVNEFITQVRNLTTEDRHTERLLNLYYNNIDELRQIVTTAVAGQDKQSHEAKAQEEQKTAYPLTIHNDIFNRLDTALIYSELSDIYQMGAAASGTVKPEVFAMAEQEKTSKNLILNSFRNYVRSESMPLTFRSYNIYEAGDNIRNEVKGDNVVNRVTSAALLNHIDKLIELGIDRRVSYDSEWIDLSKTFYNSSTNTLERMRDGNGGDVINNLTSQFTTQINNERNESEISLLTKLVHYVQEYETLPQNADVSVTEQKITESVHNYLNRLSETNLIRKSENETDVNVHLRTEADNSVSLYSRNTIDASRSINNYRNSIDSSVNTDSFTSVDTTLSTNVYNDNSQTDTTNVRNEELTQNTQELTTQEIEVTSNEQVYAEALKFINEQNIEKLTQLAGKMPTQQTPVQQGAKRLDRSQALLAAEDILNGVSPLDMEYLIPGEESTPGAKTVYEKTVESVASEQTKEIFDIVREYIDNPQKALSSGKILGNDMGSLAAEIHYLKNEPTEVPQETIIEEASERESEIIRRIAEPVIRKETREYSQQMETEKVEFVHKQTEVVADRDEILEELHRQNIALNKTNETVSTLTENVNKKNVEVHNFSTTTTQEITTDTVEQIINNRFRDDMDELTEKVFDRLEKKLVTEQKRRGF